MVKRTWLSVMLILTAAASVFANGGSDTSGESQSIEIWTTDGETERHKALSLVGDIWSVENNGAAYNIVTVNEQELPNRLATAVSANVKPDLVGFHYAFFLDKGISSLVNYSEVENAINAVGASRFGKNLDLYKLGDGNYFAVPFYGWVQGIFYRSDLFAEAGLAPPDSWENIEKAAAAFNRPEDNYYGLLIGTDPAENYTSQVFTQIAMANGVKIIRPDGSLGIDTPEMREALEYYASLAQHTPPGPQTWRARDYYFQNRLAMFFYSTYILDDLALEDVAEGSLSNENFEELEGAAFDPNLVEKTGFVPVISGPGSESASFGSTFGITIMDNGAEQGQLAGSFIRFLMEKDNYISYLHTGVGGMFPALQDIAQDPDFLADPKGLYNRYGPEMLATIANGVSNVETFEVYDGSNYPDAAQILAKLILEQMIGKVIWDGMSVDEAVKWADNEARTVLGL